MSLRELTKSMFSFSWAMSLFGLQQTANVLKPSEVRKAFDNVAEATKKELGGTSGATFKLGDDLQKGLVDSTFALFSPQILNPNTWLKMTSDILQQTFGAIGQVVPGASAGSRSQPTGWGPVPPPPSTGAQGSQ
jgi:hypothetical protein